MTTHDRAVALVAGRQHGVFARSQAIAAGCSDRMLTYRLGAGAWEHTEFTGVYRLTSHGVTWRQRLWAAALWGGPDVRIGGRAAAALYDLDRSPEGPVELLLPLHAKYAAPRSILVRRSDYLGERHEIDGLPVTDPETTLLGVARGVRPEVLDDVIESAFNARLTTPERLLLAIGRRAGSGPIRRLLRDRDPGRPRQSRLEGEFFRLAKSAGIDVVRQYEVRSGAARFFVDFAIPRLRIAIELDGFGKLATKAGKQAFLERATKLQALGWRLVHFSWEDVIGRPAYVLGILRQLEVG